MKTPYEISKPFTGPPEELLRSFVMALTQVGFRLESQSPNSRELTGPGMMSSRQSPLLGASRIQVRVESGQVWVTAELGGVARMKRFLIILIGGLCLGMAVLFGGLAAFGLLRSRNGAPFQPWFILLPFLPWVVLIPWMSSLMERRSKAAIETLVHNMTVSLSLPH